MAKKRSGTPKLRISRHFLADRRFNPDAAIRVTGVENINLQDWHRRGLIPEPRAVVGRGHRRRYSVLDLAHIYIMRTLGDAGVPLGPAFRLAMSGARRIEEYIFRQGATRNADELEQLPDCFAVLFRMDDKWQQKWFGPGGDPVPDGGIQRFMRLLNVEVATVLDISTITMLFFLRVLDELGIKG